MSEPIDRESALLWLLDRVSQRVLINMSVDLGDYSHSVFSTVGELQHWSSRPGALVATGIGDALRGTLAGLYAIGPCDFDISDPLLAAEFAVRKEPHGELAKLPGGAELVMRLGAGVEITITPAAADGVSGVDA